MTRASVAFDPDVSQWHAWTPDQAAQVLAGVGVPWYVAGGWAIDLFLGGQRREHDDLEIAVPNSRFDEVAEVLSEYEVSVLTGPREAMPLGLAGAELATTHQTWVRDPAADAWRLDVFREPSDGGTWICRRDARIRMSYDRVIERTDDGIPFGRPEIILLYKAKHAHQAKDRDDFVAALPLLEPDRRRWLLGALTLVHPGHAWLGDLEAGLA